MAVQDFLWLVDRLQRDEAIEEISKRLLGRVSEEFSKTEDKETFLKELYKVNGLGDLSIAGLWCIKKQHITDIDAVAYEKIKNQIAMLTPRKVEWHQTPPLDRQQSDAESTQGGVEPISIQTEPIKRIDSEFGKAYEKFVVAMQTGDPESKEMALYVIRLLEDIISDQNIDTIEKEVSSLLHELLTFITMNDIMDDVRVMNLLLNFEESMNHAIQKGDDERKVFLQEALDVIREYKTLFE